MRILKIRFKNLNSLAGEWEIDLTHPAFSSDGIFAITGPTGAGKTTILDAICLALYGRTPRLNKVSKNWNEIMSRQTGECYAEVTFETQAGRFRCHWSQRRAHKKPGGELQSPKHEIAHADSGQIFETRARGVAERIETATGMDFERFTRSMLLAQGGFAVFLQAAPDERAPILEQITGTEIYSLISVRVHERRSEERKKLDALSAELAGMPLLNPEDERQLNFSLDKKVQEDSELNRQVAEKNRAIVWLGGMARLEQELKQVADQKSDWRIRDEAFAPARGKLQRAMKALELAAEYAGLQSVRREQETDRQNHGQCLKLLPACEEAAGTAEEAVKLAGNELETMKSRQKEASPVIRKTRELDLRILAKDAPIKAAGETIARQEKSLEALRSKQSEDCANLDNKRKALDGLLQQIEKSRADEYLVEQLAGIRGRFDALKNLDAQRKDRAEALKAAGLQVSETARIWKERTESLETKKRELEKYQAAFAQKQFELKSLLEGRELTDWRRCLAELVERKSILDKAVETNQSLAESKQSLDDLGNRRDGLVAGMSIIAEQLKTQTERRVSLEREAGLLETQLSLLNKIQSFEDARGQLKDGDPCPLCGATEHPFAEGNIPAPDETTAALSRVREDLKAASDTVAGLKVKAAEANKDLEQTLSRQREFSEKITASETLINQQCALLSIDGRGPNLGGELRRLQQETAERLGQERKIVQSAEAMEKELALFRDLLEKAKESAGVAERETQAAAHNKESASQQFERLKKEDEAAEAELMKSLSGLQQEVSAFGVGSLSITVIDQVQDGLTARRDRWLARQKERSELDRKIAELEMQTRHQAEQIQKSESELNNQKNLLGDQLCDRDILSGQRRELFGDKNPDEEEASLSVAVETAEKRLDASRLALNSARQELDKLKTRMEELAKSTAARTDRLKSEEKAFGFRLGLIGFADENDFVEACLPENERQTLMRQAQKLADEQTELTARERDKTEKLQDERKKQLTDRSLDELNREVEELVAGQKELQQEIGGIRQRLKDNEDLKQKQQERVQIIDAQKRECSWWDMLHELIGSADGKKYRNFAQGLTFEMMIGHANRQLQKMTDRYLLLRDDAQPLELNVIDNYQAGEVRSTKNLSGGESFIVSLSLALGLSHMASKNVRVDSLFLDEGFGTLDEEALDTALETLAGLQQDGKLIGVISHVPALKERIGTQIQVTPQTGGRSVISGPGCGRPAAGTEV